MAGTASAGGCQGKWRTSTDSIGVWSVTVTAGEGLLDQLLDRVRIDGVTVGVSTKFTQILPL